MTNPLKTPQAHSVALLLARVPIGIFFLIEGYAIVGHKGMDSFTKTYSPGAERFMSAQLASTFLHVLPWVEMLVGITLMVGIFTRVAASLATLILIFFITCGAAGIAFDASGSRPPLNPYVVFLGLTLLLMTTGGGEMTVDHTFKKAPPGPPAKK